MNQTKLVTAADLGAPHHGFGCVGCNHLFIEGEEYIECLIGMVEDIPMVEVKCPSCHRWTTEGNE